MKRCCSFLLVFLSTFLHAQNFDRGEIKGVVTSDGKAPVEYATVLLKNATDSSLYKGDLTGADGVFQFAKINAGTYFLEINSTGFTKQVISSIKISETDSLHDLGAVSLTTQTLGGVTISADKPFIEHQADRTVVNIENSTVHAGTTVSEVMEKLPGVQVSQDGTISLKGKSGVIVMIDNRPVMLSGDELANLLRGMPSSGVQKIEIITNPPARYDAAGNAGIINIVTKKNRREGISGSVTAGYGQGQYEKYNGSISLGWKNKKCNLLFNYSYAHNMKFNDIYVTRKLLDHDTTTAFYNTHTWLTAPLETHNPRASADFYLSPKTTLSVLATAAPMSLDIFTRSHTNISNSSEQPTGSYDFDNRSYGNWSNYAFNTELRHDLDTNGSQISGDLDYARYWSGTKQDYTTLTNDAVGNLVNNALSVSDQRGNLFIYAAKVDYTQMLKNHMRFEAGAKSSLVNTDNDSRFYAVSGNEQQLDSSRSNHFLYNENINAAYLNWNREMEKWTLQFGLRAEQTVADGEQVYTGQTFTRRYAQLFPSAFFNYQLNKKHALNLSFGRRVDRPAYQQMNPYRLVIDATSYKMGNPYLRPEIGYNSELTWSYDNMLSITAGYSLSTDVITEVIIREANTYNTMQTTVNLSHTNYYNLNISYTKKLFPWWTTNTSIFSYYAVYAGTINNHQLSGGTPYVNISTNNSIPFAEGWSAECSYYWTNKFFYGISTYLPAGNLVLGVQKTLFQKRGSVTLNATDVLLTNYTRLMTQLSDIDESWTVHRDLRVVTLSFSYRFGKGSTRIRRNTGADDEKKRTSVG